MLFNLSSIVLREAFKQHKILLARLVSHYPIGRIFFWISIGSKRLSLLFGRYSQRAVEYPWVIKSLCMVPRKGLVLDVGCAESLLSQELIARGFRVVGIDIRDYPFKDKRMMFLKQNVLNTTLPDNTFDAIVVVSTIEHIGLEPYGQMVKDTDGDLRAMKELIRILKHEGVLILTTPYTGGALRVTSFERTYDRHRLGELTRGLKIIKEDYFYPLRSGKRLHWLRFSKEKMDNKTFEKESGIACLILKKPPKIEPPLGIDKSNQYNDQARYVSA
jgi:SAM-dependent methyltransferase